MLFPGLLIQYYNCMDKSQLRQTYTALRQRMSYTEVRLKTQKISEQFVAYMNLSPRHILIYTPLRKFNEIDPVFIKKVFPKATLAIAPFDKNGRISDNKQFDLIIVPMVAADLKCHRLGFGGGWYDRFLSTQPNSVKVGLCYDSCVIEGLPYESHDIALDAIITDKRVITAHVE